MEKSLNTKVEEQILKDLDLKSKELGINRKELVTKLLIDGLSEETPQKIVNEVIEVSNDTFLSDLEKIGYENCQETNNSLINQLNKMKQDNLISEDRIEYIEKIENPKYKTKNKWLEKENQDFQQTIRDLRKQLKNS